MEGPSLIILREEVAFLKGRKISGVTTTTRLDPRPLLHQTVRDFLSYGKHFLIVLDRVTIRVHFLMFGSYRINEQKDRPPRLSLVFDTDVLNLYTCAVTLLDEDLNDVYDWQSDVMSPLWNEKKARNKLKKLPEANVGDALLDQTIFAGVGNIIKNEVLYRIRVHPESLIGALRPRKLTELVREARQFSFDFYDWKKIWQLRKNLGIYKKKKCRRCDLPVLIEHTGTKPRLTFFCSNCQIHY